jgi:hypothetical protein
MFAYSSEKSRCSSVSIATGSTAGIRFPGGTSDFSVFHNVQTGSGAHPISFPKGIGDSFPGVKWPGREADHSPQVPRSRKGGAISPLPIRLHGLVL